MKTCDVCGTRNFKENNYCTHCGNKLILEHICPVCGEINSDAATHCIKCNNQLNPISIDDFDILFNDFNQNLLTNANVDDSEYLELLSNIFVRADYIDIWGETTKNKILNLASIFTECKPKSRGYERGFIFLGTCIFYEDRLADSVQIATIIHELAHYFLFNIIESLLCDILKVKPSSVIQSFVWYFLMFPEFKIMSEYCAHTVEGRYVLFGYQDYSSYNMIRNEFLKSYSKDHEEAAKLVGNTFAYYIKTLLNSYIDENMRDEIKREYEKLTDEKNYAGAMAEIDSYLQWEEFREAIRIILTGNIDRYIINLEDIKKIKEEVQSEGLPRRSSN